MIDRDRLHGVLAELQAARRAAQADADAHTHANIAAPATAGPRDESLEQSLVTLVRLLDQAGKDVRDAIATIDQRDRARPPA